jgi:hypothetical protein
LYVDLPTFKDYRNISTGGSDATIQRILEAAQKEIENRCGTIFETSSATRYYRPEAIRDIPVGGQTEVLGTYGRGFSWDWSSLNTRGYRVLELGRDIASITLLINGNNTTISSTGYVLEPRNQPPYRQIRLLSAQSWIFDTDGEIAVTGLWGYSTAPPADIIEATLEMANYLYSLRDSPIFDITASPDLGIITVPKGFPAHVEQILAKGGYLSPWRHIA